MVGEHTPKWQLSHSKEDLEAAMKKVQQGLSHREAAMKKVQEAFSHRENEQKIQNT